MCDTALQALELQKNQIFRPNGIQIYLYMNIPEGDFEQAIQRKQRAASFPRSVRPCARSGSSSIPQGSLGLLPLFCRGIVRQLACLAPFAPLFQSRHHPMKGGQILFGQANPMEDIADIANRGWLLFCRAKKAGTFQCTFQMIEKDKQILLVRERRLIH